MEKPLIFVTNDDSLAAKGIAELVAVAQHFGEVVVIAPDKPQSGMGHAITINDPLRLVPSSKFEPITAYSCSGTPVDCVKIGIYEVLHRKPDLVLSGINHGQNASTNVLYSGTMSAAIEGAMEHIPSIGFSLDNFDHNADFSLAKHVVAQLIPIALKHKMPHGICWNVNVPNCTIEQFKGIKSCKQAYAFWEDRFEKRADQFGRPYYWLTGNFEMQDKDPSTDLFALKENYATVVPTQFDLTAYKHLTELEQLLKQSAN